MQNFIQLNRLGYRAICVATVTVILVLSAILPISAAKAQQTLGIAAIVNNEIITGYDLDSRIKFILFSSKLPPEMYQRIKPQVLRTLLDEKLKLQEAKRQKIKISRKEMGGAIRSIEKRNNLGPGGMIKLLKQNNIDPSTFERQLEVELAWTRLIRGKVQRTVNIDDDAVDDAMKSIMANKGKPEYLAAEIFLPFDRRKPESEIENLAKRLHGQLRGGAKFPEIARSFSASASAATGGGLGWLREDQLDPALAKTLVKLSRGQMSPIIKGNDGFYILFLRNKRVGFGLPQPNLKLTLQQLFIPVPKGSAPTETAQQQNAALSIGQNARNCRDFDSLGRSIKSGNMGRLEDVSLSDMAPLVRSQTQDLPVGKASKPIRTPAGLLVIMVCSRSGGQNSEAQREQVRRMLTGQRAQLISRRTLRDLKRVSVVDIR